MLQYIDKCGLDCSVRPSTRVLIFTLIKKQHASAAFSYAGNCRLNLADEVNAWLEVVVSWLPTCWTNVPRIF